MMITAKEANTIITKAIEEVQKKQLREAEIFCEGLSEAIVRNAKAQISNYIFKLPLNVKRLMVVEILETNGYQVNERGDGTIEIMW